MDLKNILQEEEKSSIKENIIDTKGEEDIRVHKKPIQLRDIENRSSGNKVASKHNESVESMKDLLNKEKQESMKKQWNKLDRGIRINRLKLFIKSQKEEKKLTSDEEEILNSIIMKALKSNKLNKNNDVKYDIESCEIESIKELKYDDKTRKYILNVPEVKKSKSTAKSRSNIDRFLKNH